MEYDVTHAPSPVDGDRFLILTNADGAVNFKLDDRAGRRSRAATHWTEVVPHRPDVKLEGVTAFADHLVRYERREGVRRIVVMPYADGAERELDDARGGVRHRPGHQRRVRHPHAAVHLHVARHAEHRVRRGPRHRRAHAPQADRGARRPRPGGLRDGSAVGHRARRHAGADLLRAPRRTSPHDGTAPCLLYGYGSYEACMDPTLLHPAAVAARPRVRVRHRPRPRRRRAGPALVRRRQAAPQAQHVHRLHRLRRAPRGRGRHRARAPRGPRRVGRRAS